MEGVMPIRASVYIGMVVVGGAWAIFRAMSAWHSDDIMRLACYVTVAILVSGFKINLPGFKGTMSVNFLFILIGISEMTLGETILIGCLSTLAQCLYKSTQ